MIQILDLCLGTGRMSGTTKGESSCGAASRPQAHMLLLLLLSVLASQTVAQYDMTEFQQVSPHVDTGFYASTLQHIWHKYNDYQGSAPGTFGDRLPVRIRNPKMRAFYFYLIFVYIHKLPQRNWLESYKSASGKYKCGRSTFDREVFPMAAALADIIAEIDYTWRLDPHNHALPPFDKYITGIVDTCPVPLACPADFHHASLYFQVSLPRAALSSVLASMH